MVAWDSVGGPRGAGALGLGWGLTDPGLEDCGGSVTRQGQAERKGGWGARGCFQNPSLLVARTGLGPDSLGLHRDPQGRGVLSRTALQQGPCA